MVHNRSVNNSTNPYCTKFRTLKDSSFLQVLPILVGFFCGFTDTKFHAFKKYMYPYEINCW